MEVKLDQVESGSQGWLQVIEEFYQRFHQAVERAQTEMTDVKRAGVPTDIDCEQCGKKMHIRWGKNGLFLSCSGYPDCKNSSPGIVRERFRQRQRVRSKGSVNFVTGTW